MIKTNSSIYNFFKVEKLFFFILYISLLIGFFLSENSTGGAILDYKNQKIITKSFIDDFYFTFYNYDTFSSRHSPVLIIFLSFLEKMNIQDNFIRLFHLHLCLILPFIFFRIIKEKFDFRITNKIAIILVGLIFLSPTFRTLAIWPDSRLLGLVLFSLSLLFFLKFLNERKFKYVVFNTLGCAFSSYISPNFSLFYLYFFIHFILYYKIFSKEILMITIISILLCTPAFVYVFILDINFMQKSAVIGGLDKSNNIFFINIFNNILITFSIIFFYLIPFLFTKIIKIKNVFTIKNIFLSLIILFILVINFDYQYEVSGGGIFFKISNYFFKNNILFFGISFISILFIVPILKKRKFNFLVFILIILNNPQYTIYHKYFDPFLLIMFFSIFFLKFDLKLILIKKNIFFIYSFFVLFFLLSVYK